MHRMSAFSSSSAGGEGSLTGLALQPLALAPRFADGGVSVASTFFVCWPLVARPDLRISSVWVR